MKKRILIIATALFFSFFASFANGSGHPVPKYVTTVFADDFSQARDSKWEIYNGYYKVSFNDQGKTAYAFYTRGGEFMGFAVHMSADKLPVALRTIIAEQYSGYWISDLYQYTIDTTAGFFITLENADHRITLKAEAGETWSLFAREKKSEL
jgi:hypothetical protein